MNRKCRITVALGLLLACFSARLVATDLDLWLATEHAVAIERMLANISPQDATRGVVVASPRRAQPNYFRHWIRDAAIVMNIVVSLYENAPPEKKQYYLNILTEWVDFERRNQLGLIDRLGEPLVLHDGSPLDEEWGRPQEDGPALRAITAIRFAHALLRGSGRDVLSRLLYDSRSAPFAFIRTDLEHIAKIYQSMKFNLPVPSFDPWEEEAGDVFYVRMVQRKALIEGARLARLLGDDENAARYQTAGHGFQAYINDHWSEEKGYFEAVKNRVGGVDYRTSKLDVSVILGAMHGDTQDDFLPIYDEKLLSTAIHLEWEFRRLYAINHNGLPGILIGRYPEDIWDGEKRSTQGHPWLLATNAFAEYYSRVAKGLVAKGEIYFSPINIPFFQAMFDAEHWPLMREGVVAKAGDWLFNSTIVRLRQKSRSFLERVRYHADSSGGAYTELADRDTGFLRGVPNLTWTCASYVVAAWEVMSHH